MCYEQWSLSIGNGHFQHLAEQKPLDRSKQKFERLIRSARSQSRPKFIMIGWGVAAPHIGEIYGSWSFFSGDFSGKRTADPERSSPIYYTPIDAVPAKDVPFRVSSIRLIPWGVFPEKILGTPMGIPSLNVYGRISAHEKRMTTLDSSKCASR
jgi:hypothetical protein